MVHSIEDGVPKTKRTVPDAPTAEVDQEVFSPVNIRDRVVIMALFYEIVQVEQVEAAWHKWIRKQRSGATDSLWHMLVRDPDVNRDALYEVAAQIYGFEQAEINRLRARALIRDLSESVTDEQWQCLFELLVAPIAVGQDPRTGHARLVFATHDPTRPEVPRLLQRIGIENFELRYAAPSQITELFAEIFGPAVADLFLNGDDPMLTLGDEPKPPSADEPVREETVELDEGSLVNWFESVLIAASETRATEIHIFLNDEQELEIHFHIDDRLVSWRKERTFHPEGLLAYIMDDIIRVENFEPGVVMQVYFQRWIDRQLTRFHITIRPAEDSDELSAGTIVIRVLGHRETSEDGMGPWKAH